MADTKISWTQKVWNPCTGCTKVSAGCRHCYAETIDQRFHKNLYGEPFIPWTVKAQRESGKPAVKLHPERLEQPLHWKKPCRVFVNSMSDLFHENVPFEFVIKVFDVMRVGRQHTYQILTKRPDRMYKFFRWTVENDVGFPMRVYFPMSNVHLGVSVENQRAAEERIPLLLQTPAAVRLLSVEPMLGRVNLTWIGHDDPDRDGVIDALRGEDWIEQWWDQWGQKRTREVMASYPGIDWVIAGCESRPGKRPGRPMNIDWVRDLRDQCIAAGVPFFLKQMEVGGKVIEMPELDGQRWTQMPEVR